jgi:hypothetical protein
MRLLIVDAVMKRSRGVLVDIGMSSNCIRVRWMVVTCFVGEAMVDCGVW